MKKYRLVIVENDEDERFFMNESFLAEGLFEVLDLLASGDELFDWLERQNHALPDVILSDLNMPGKNGYDIIEHVCGSPRYRHIPVIITSTSSARTIIEKCLQMGAAEYLVKPDTFVEYGPYVQSLYRLIEERQLVRAPGAGEASS